MANASLLWLHFDIQFESKHDWRILVVSSPVNDIRQRGSGLCVTCICVHKKGAFVIGVRQKLRSGKGLHQRFKSSFTILVLSERLIFCHQIG